MFRGTTARILLALLGVLLLALQLRAPGAPFAAAVTAGPALTATQTGTTSLARSAHEDAETVRTSGRAGGPAGVPQMRDRHRGPAPAGAPARPGIPVRAAGTEPARPAGVPHRPAAGALRAHTPAALQVFRC
ncbi:hypothetical protein ACH4NF_29105 [Streptomyces sp. NPDC017248]|uniref:hypothetical protein n=1 Tax=unclassified Streptomyces TaxID=2593676 RepID=UPI0037AB81CA